MTLRVLGIIPARAGSKGLPGKNVKLLDGRPLVSYTFDAAKASSCVDRVVVTTDSERVAELARAARVEVPFMRPAALSGDTSPTIAAVRHCLDWLERVERYTPDIVVLLQPTAPLRTARDIDHCVAVLAGQPDTDAVVSVREVPAEFNPEWQLVLGLEGLICHDGRSLAELAPSRQLLTTTYTRNGAVYAFRRDAERRTGSIYGERCAPYVMAGDASVNIDGPEDWARAEALLRARRERLGS